MAFNGATFDKVAFDGVMFDAVSFDGAITGVVALLDVVEFPENLNSNHECSDFVSANKMFF